MWGYAGLPVGIMPCATYSVYYTFSSPLSSSYLTIRYLLTLIGIQDPHKIQKNIHINILMIFIQIVLLASFCILPAWSEVFRTIPQPGIPQLGIIHHRTTWFEVAWRNTYQLTVSQHTIIQDAISWLDLPNIGVYCYAALEDASVLIAAECIINLDINQLDPTSDSSPEINYLALEAPIVASVNYRPHTIAQRCFLLVDWRPDHINNQFNCLDKSSKASHMGCYQSYQIALGLLMSTSAQTFFPYLLWQVQYIGEYQYIFLGCKCIYYAR